MDDEPTGTDPPEATRLEHGLAMYRRVYGADATVFAPGDAEFFDLMISQLFGEVWTRPALDIPTRRLLVMGVLAAQHHFDTLQLQFARALETGELTIDQVREAVIQLIPYVGYPSSGALYRAGETAIAEHLARPEA
jgi:alkylhydroperoxidase/carboxymuconolactone decarboxylase family protein YurZ